MLLHLECFQEKEKNSLKKEMQNNCCLQSISFWCAFFSVTSDHHITCGYDVSVSVYIWIFIFAVFFYSFNFLRTFRQSVWHFHFANSFVYLAGSRRVRWTENICYPFSFKIKLNKDAKQNCDHSCSFSVYNIYEMQEKTKSLAVHGTCKQNGINFYICAG